MTHFKNITKEEALEILNISTPKEVINYYNNPYKIKSEELEFYRVNGFVTLSNVVEKYPLDYARNLIQAAVYLKKEDDKRTLAEKTPYEQSFLQCGFLSFEYPAVKDLVFGKRFAGIAQDLMKVNGIRLWHDQALFKEVGGRATPVHQDSSYWPIQNPALTTTMWLSLNGSSKDNGCLYFYPGTHKAEKEYVDIFKNPHEPERLKKIEKVYAPLNAGDATYHSGLTFHGTDENRTEEMRKGMTIIYLNDGNKFDASDKRNSTHKSCDGLKSGQIINTIYTPKLI